MTWEISSRDNPDYVKAVSVQKAFRQNQYGIFTLNRSWTNSLYTGLENSKMEGKEQMSGSLQQKTFNQV